MSSIFYLIGVFIDDTEMISPHVCRAMFTGYKNSLDSFKGPLGGAKIISRATYILTKEDARPCTVCTRVVKLVPSFLVVV
jgi:hypothetical protein